MSKMFFVKKKKSKIRFDNFKIESNQDLDLDLDLDLDSRSRFLD